MDQGFMQVEAALKGIIDNLSPAERKKAFGEIAKAIRASNQKRIASQVDPDGNPFAPRIRKKKGAIRRSMFTNRPEIGSFDHSGVALTWNKTIQPCP